LHALRQLWPSLNERHRRDAPQLARLDLVQPAAVDAALAALFFLTVTTKPTFRAKFKLGEGGKIADYMARPPRHGESSTRRICDWINTRGEKGPWSEIAMATVAA